MKILNFLFFADIVHTPTCDRALRALIQTQNPPHHKALSRRGGFPASQAAQDLQSSLSEAARESALLRAIQLASKAGIPRNQ